MQWNSKQVQKWRLFPVFMKKFWPAYLMASMFLIFVKKFIMIWTLEKKIKRRAKKSLSSNSNHHFYIFKFAIKVNLNLCNIYGLFDVLILRHKWNKKKYENILLMALSADLLPLIFLNFGTLVRVFYENYIWNWILRKNSIEKVDFLKSFGWLQDLLSLGHPI